MTFVTTKLLQLIFRDNTEIIGIELMTTLPPIKALFTDSFHTLKKVFAPFLIFNILIFAASIFALILMGIGLFLLGFGAFFSGALNNTPFALSMGGIVSILVFILIFALLSSVAQIGQIIILYEEKTKTSVIGVIKRSGKFIIPLIVTSIITGFIVLGGLFLLVIPGMIFALFLIFGMYSVITENKTPLQALRRSVFLVKNNFSAFILRMLALWGVLIGIIIITSILGGIFSGSEEAAGIFQIINFIIQILVSWYSISYSVTLFKQLQATNKTSEGSLKLFTILSIVGWVLGIVLGFIIFNTVAPIIQSAFKNTDSFRNELTPAEQAEFDRIINEIETDYNSGEIEQSFEDLEGPTIPEETSTEPAETAK